MDLDDLTHGFLSFTRWNSETWDKVKPLVLQLASGAKGDSVNATKHLSQIMHHRDPMRCPIAMLVILPIARPGLRVSRPARDDDEAVMRKQPADDADGSDGVP